MIGDRYFTNELADLNPPGLFNSEGNRRMITESKMREAANRAFVTAFLLAGNAERAEAAVLKSIGLVNCDDPSGDDLIRGTVNHAIEAEEIPERFPRRLEPAFLRLPFELQRVLQLPRHPRQCFVLRVLVGLPRDICARLLHSEVRQIDEGACAAMLQLPASRRTSFASH